MNDEELRKDRPPTTLSDMYYHGDSLKDFVGNDDNIYDSRNTHEVHKIFWYTMDDEILTSHVVSKNKKNYVSYEMSKEYDIVTSSEMEIKTPRIQVKEFDDQEVEIAFCQDFCIHFIKEGKLILDNYKLDCGPHAMMILKNFFTTRPQDIDELLGNDDCTTFASTLPEKYFNFPLLWDHSRNEVKSIPLFYFLKHYYLFDFEKDMTQLLRMRTRRIQRDDDGILYGEWHEIPFDANFLTKKDITIEKPVVTVSYRKIPDEEKSWRFHEKKPLIYHDFIVDVTENVVSPGKLTKVKPDVPDDVGVQAFFFYAYAPERKLLGVHSDFQNTHHRCPIETFSLNYAKNVEKESNQRVERFQKIKSYQHFPCKPRNESISVVPLCHKPGSLYTDRAVDLSKKGVKFTFKMRQENASNYHVVLITMVVRKIQCIEPSSYTLNTLYD